MEISTQNMIDQEIYNKQTSEKIITNQKKEAKELSSKLSNSKDKLDKEILTNSNSSEDDNDFNENDRQQSDDSKEAIKRLISDGLQAKALSNKLFKNGSYFQSRASYQKALECFQQEEETNPVLKLTNLYAIKIECMINISVCSLILKEYEKTIQITNEILNTNDNNHKALTIKAKALMLLGRKREALNVIKRAIAIKPSKTLLYNLQKLETSTDSDNTNATIEENNEDNGMMTDQMESNTNTSVGYFSRFTLVKIFKIIYYMISELIKKRKLFLLLIGMLVFVAKRKGIENIWNTIISYIFLGKWSFKL